MREASGSRKYDDETFTTERRQSMADERCATRSKRTRLFLELLAMNCSLMATRLSLTDKSARGPTRQANACLSHVLGQRRPGPAREKAVAAQQRELTARLDEHRELCRLVRTSARVSSDSEAT